MTVDEFVDQAKARLELFRLEVKKEDSPTPPDSTPKSVVPKEEMEDLGVTPYLLDDFQMWLQEFAGWESASNQAADEEDEENHIG